MTETSIIKSDLKDRKINKKIRLKKQNYQFENQIKKTERQ